jgi:hypothetical protein
MNFAGADTSDCGSLEGMKLKGDGDPAVRKSKTRGSRGGYMPLMERPKVQVEEELGERDLRYYSF